MPRIDLYVELSSPPCQAVLLTAQHIGVEVNQKIVDLFAGDQLKPEFIRINPARCVPAMDDGGFYLGESRAIQTYLVNKYSPDNPIYPKDPQARAIVDRMLYFDIGTLYMAEANYLYPGIFPDLFKGTPGDPEKAEAFKKALDLLEGFLSKTAYAAANHITLADFSILASLSFAQVLTDYSYSHYPKISSWMEKLKSEIPSYKQIVEKPLIEYKEILNSRYGKRKIL